MKPKKRDDKMNKIKEIIEKKEKFHEDIRKIEEKIDELNAEMTEKHFEIQKNTKTNDKNQFFEYIEIAVTQKKDCP